MLCLFWIRHSRFDPRTQCSSVLLVDATTKCWQHFSHGLVGLCYSQLVGKGWNRIHSFWCKFTFLFHLNDSNFYILTVSKITQILLFAILGWGKFYPKKVIQIRGLKLSTQISHVNFLSRRVIKKCYPKTYFTSFWFRITYFTFSRLCHRLHISTSPCLLSRCVFRPALGWSADQHFGARHTLIYLIITPVKFNNFFG